MKTANAIRKLEREGLSVQHNGRDHWAETHGWEISVHDQDGDVIAIHVKQQSEKDNYTSDYFPGSYFPSLAQALRFLERAMADTTA